MSLDEPSATADDAVKRAATAPASGEVPLRRPRDNRRRRSSGRTGAISTGAIATAAEAAGAAGAAGPATPAGAPPSRAGSAAPSGAVPVPQARTTGTPPSGLTGPIRQFLSPMTGSLRLGRTRAEGGTDQRLRVDWPQCKAHGLCAEIAPEIIHLDEWGYPVFDGGALAPEDVPTARRAMQVCPTLALRLADVPDKL